MIEAAFARLISNKAQLLAHIPEMLVPRDVINPFLEATLTPSGTGTDMR
jgi:hypothetical protein